MKTPYVEVFALSPEIDLIREDKCKLSVKTLNYETLSREETNPLSDNVLHAALDTIIYMQDQLNKQKRFIYALDSLLEVAEINGLHDYDEYKRAKKLVRDYEGD